MCDAAKQLNTKAMAARGMFFLGLDINDDEVYCCNRDGMCQACKCNKTGDVEFCNDCAYVHYKPSIEEILC